MSVMPIYLYGNQVLKKKAIPVKEINDEKVHIIMDMLETMKQANGMGLAANQVGLSDAIIVIDLTDVDEEKDEPLGIIKEHKKPLIFINPKITDSWGEWSIEEGCLSIPDLRIEVVRPEFIKLTYRDGNFDEQHLEVGGLLSRVIQHEYDHLNGILFPERIDKQKLVEFKQQIKDIKRGEVGTNYPVIVA
jgi:peptide deformylase